jgi:hypothetical protein
MRHDLYHNIKSDISIKTADVTAATVTGEIVDVAGFESIAINVITGPVTTADASNYYSIVLYEAADAAMATESAVAAADIMGTQTVINASATQLNKSFTFGYKGVKRYLRVKAIETGTAQATITALVIKGNPHVAPAV